MKQVQIKHLCTFFGDGDWIESKDQSESGIRLIQTGNIGDGVFKDRIEKARWVSDETFKKLNCTELKNGDVLISRLPDPVGRACVLPKLEHRAITAVDCAILRFKKDLIIPEYFVYYSQSDKYQNDINSFITGSTRERISRANLGEIEVPVPSLDKQREIVEKLDYLFEEIESLEAKLSSSKVKINLIRESKLDQIFGGNNLSTSSISEVKLGDIARIINGRAYKQSELLNKGIYPVLRVGNFFSNRNWYYSDLELDPDKYCDNGDLLYAWSASFGPRIWDGGKVIFHYHIWKIEEEPEVVSREWLFWWLLWDVSQIKIAHGTGTTMMHVTKGAMENRVINLPPLSKQIEQVSELFKLQNAFIEIADNYEKKRSRYVDLRNAILYSIFQAEVA